MGYLCSRSRGLSHKFDHRSREHRSKKEILGLRNLLRLLSSLFGRSNQAVSHQRLVLMLLVHSDHRMGYWTFQVHWGKKSLRRQQHQEIHFRCFQAMLGYVLQGLDLVQRLRLPQSVGPLRLLRHQALVLQAATVRHPVVSHCSAMNHRPMRNYRCHRHLVRSLLQRR